MLKIVNKKSKAHQLKIRFGILSSFQTRSVFVFLQIFFLVEYNFYDNMSHDMNQLTITIQVL